MQLAFDLGAAAEFVHMRDRLRARFGPVALTGRLAPINQLVKSLLGSRTRDEVSWRAYERLVGNYPRWSEAAAAETADLEAIIAGVTFADVKARRLKQALLGIAASAPDFDLSTLAGRPVDEALGWLERFPGVGRKVASATLNFSTLARPAFVIDTHILRVLRRLGFVRPSADTEAAYAAVMQAAAGWSADELVELHALLKKLGQTLCHAERAGCGACTLCGMCKASRLHF